MQKLKKELPQRTVQKLVKKAFGEKEKSRKMTLLHGGLFNTTYRIDLQKQGSVILRAGPHKRKVLLSHEKNLLKRETAIGQHLHQNRIPVPGILFKDFSKKLVSRDYIFAEFCKGKNWHYRMKRLSASENTLLYRHLGQLAARIHSVDLKRNSFGFPYPYSGKASWRSFMESLVLMMSKDLKAYSLREMPESIHPETLFCRISKVFDEIKTPSLLHGDLWPRNVLMENNSKHVAISALLDCERGLFGDRDFEWVFHCFPLPASFWRGYGGKGKITENRRIRHLFYKGYYLLVASLEEIVHFGRKRSHLKLFEMAEKVFNTLRKEV